MSMYNSYIEKTSKSIKSNKSTRELTVPVSSLSVFVIDFEQYGGPSLPIKKIKIKIKKKKNEIKKIEKIKKLQKKTHKIIMTHECQI